MFDPLFPTATQYDPFHATLPTPPFEVNPPLVLLNQVIPSVLRCIVPKEEGAFPTTTHIEPLHATPEQFVKPFVTLIQFDPSLLYCILGELDAIASHLFRAGLALRVVAPFTIMEDVIVEVAPIDPFTFRV
jgi:hypothetical protein